MSARHGKCVPLMIRGRNGEDLFATLNFSDTRRAMGIKIPLTAGMCCV